MIVIKDSLFYALQWPLPTLALSSLMHLATQAETESWKNLLIDTVISVYNIDMSDYAVEDPHAYESFNAFFTRALKPGARPLAPEPAIVSPVDGTMSQFGTITGDDIFQAKGRSYTATALLGGHEDLAAQFTDGEFATIYLAPYNYHRIHMPITGTPREIIYVPGRLFSVNPATVRTADALFARNERVIVTFDTELGPMAMVLVGALFVGSMETVLTGQITPPHDLEPFRRSVPEGTAALERGAELGRFNMGSTVIMLLPNNAVRWRDGLKPAQPMVLGHELAQPHR